MPYHKSTSRTKTMPKKTKVRVKKITVKPKTKTKVAVKKVTARRKK